jgi:hypothetical protein
MKNGQTMRAAGWISGQGPQVCEIRGRHVAILSGRRLVEIELPAGEVVALGAGPTLLMDSGAAWSWSFDTRRWQPVGSMKMESIALKSKPREPQVVVVRDVPRQAVAMGTFRALRTHQLGHGQGALREGDLIELPANAADTKFAIASRLLERVPEPVAEAKGGAR